MLFSQKRSTVQPTPGDLLHPVGDYNYTNIYDVADDDHEDNSFGYIDEDFGIGQRSSEDELQSELEYLIGEMSRCAMIII